MCCAHHLIIKTSNDLSTFTFTYEHMNMQHYVWCLKLLFPPYHQQINFTPPPPPPTYFTQNNSNKTRIFTDTGNKYMVVLELRS